MLIKNYKLEVVRSIIFLFLDLGGGRSFLVISFSAMIIVCIVKFYETFDAWFLMEVLRKKNNFRGRERNNILFVEKICIE